MHKILCLLIISIISVTNGLTQNSYKFVFNGAEHGYMTLVKPENDDSFLIGNINYDLDAKPIGSSIYTFSNQDSTNHMQWNLDLIKEDTALRLFDIHETEDGGWMLFGIANITFLNDSVEDICYCNWMMKLDENKDMQWIRYLSSPDEVNATDELIALHVLELRSGNYLYAESVVNDSLPYIINIFIRKVTSDGDVIFTRIYDSSIGGHVMSLSYGIDSSFYMLHKWGFNTYDCQNGTGAFFLDTTNFDTIGYVCYSSLSGPSFSRNYNARIHPNGEMIVAGQFLSTGTNLCVRRYNNNYHIIDETVLVDWDTTFYAAYETCLFINDQGDIIVGGDFDHLLGFYLTTYDMVYAAKLDAELNLLSERYFERDAEHIVIALAGAADGGIVIGGYQYDYLVNQPYEGDPFFIKTDAGLWLDNPPVSDPAIHRALIYPNPGKSYLIFRTTVKEGLLRFYDATGVIVLEKKSEGLETRIDISSIAPGVYLWTLVLDGKTIDKGKWIKFNN